MKNFVNIAKAEYTINGQRKYVLSNRWTVASGLNSNCISGRIICKDNCRPWRIRILCTADRHTVYSLQGVHPRSFSFDVSPEKKYIVEFSAHKQCCMRLYNIPDNVCDVRWQDTD